jgi:hypothetical protein
LGGQEGIIVVAWTRAELTAVREAIEFTPGFDGRTRARDAVRTALRAQRISPLVLDEQVARQLAARIVPVDTATATARAKLQRAVRTAPALGAS